MTILLQIQLIFAFFDVQVTVAKKIAKDMEKWAKTLNQRKESTKVAVQPPPLASSPTSSMEPDAQRPMTSSMEKSSLTEVLQVLQRKQLADNKKSLSTTTTTTTLSSNSSSAIVAAYGSDSDSDTNDKKKLHDMESSLIDWSKLACLLCQRQFANKETLLKHQQLSDLHKQNLDVWKKQYIPSSSTSYRDRAKERRAKFGDQTPPKKKVCLISKSNYLLTW